MLRYNFDVKHEFNIEIRKVRVNNYKTKGLGINNPTQDSFFFINNSPIITLIKNNIALNI